MTTIRVLGKCVINITEDVIELKDVVSFRRKKYGIEIVGTGVNQHDQQSQVNYAPFGIAGNGMVNPKVVYRSGYVNIGGQIGLITGGTNVFSSPFVRVDNPAKRPRDETSDDIVCLKNDEKIEELMIEGDSYATISALEKLQKDCFTIVMLGSGNARSKSRMTRRIPISVHFTSG